jgi:hypothetical protein
VITLAPEQLDSLLAGVRSDLVERIMVDAGGDLTLMSGAQVCGLLNINQKTLDALGTLLPRVSIVPGSVIRYRLSDVRSFIQSRTA